jgi:hypothetical protein
VSGRHESWQVRRWAPTALNAVVALVPAGAMLSAVGAAGTGYLLHRPDIAAAGAGTAAVGLAVERLQNRNLRIRARRERWEWRAEREQLRESLDELRRDLEEAHHTLNVLRSRIHTLHERDADTTPRPTLTELAARQRLARQVTLDDAPTMPLRRIDQPAVAGPVPPSPFHGNPFQPSPFRPVQVPAAQARPEPLLPDPLPLRPSVAAPAAGRPTPADPERRRPLVTLARPQVVLGTDGWRPFEPVRPHTLFASPVAGPPVPTPAPAAQVPAPQAPTTRTPVAQTPVAQTPVAQTPAAWSSSAPAAGAAAVRGTGQVTSVPGTGRVPSVPGAGRVPSPAGPVSGPIALGPLAEPPHLPVLPAGPAEPVHPAGGLSMLPPGPRDPVSGPLAIIVDLTEASRPSTLPSETMPATAVDAMVYAAIDQFEADELTATLERLDDPDRGGRHAGSAHPEEGVQPSGLVVVGASVVGDPQARARRGRHSA